MKLAGIALHTSGKGVSDYCYHCCVLGAIAMGCVDISLEKKRVRFWVKVGAG